MRFKLLLLVALLLSAGVVIIGRQIWPEQFEDPQNCLEINGHFFYFTKDTNAARQSDFIELSKPFDSVVVASPGLERVKATECADTGDLIYVTFNTDSIVVDYQIGKIQLIENQLPNDFSLNFILDGNRLRSEELSVIFINEESKMHRIAGVRNLDRLLNDVEVSQPNYIVFENLKFSGGDVTEIGLHDSFLLEIDR